LCVFVCICVCGGHACMCVGRGGGGKAIRLLTPRKPPRHSQTHNRAPTPLHPQTPQTGPARRRGLWQPHHHHRVDAAAPIQGAGRRLQAHDRGHDSDPPLGAPRALAWRAARVFLEKRVERTPACTGPPRARRGLRGAARALFCCSALSLASTRGVGRLQGTRPARRPSALVGCGAPAAARRAAAGLAPAPPRPTTFQSLTRRPPGALWPNASARAAIPRGRRRVPPPTSVPCCPGRGTARERRVVSPGPPHPPA
jgi:hypothetical protein